MERQTIYKEIEEKMGLVPTMFKTLPDNVLEHEWRLFKETDVKEGTVPPKYRELTGVAVAAARGCPYCTFFHTEMARLNGANDREIQETLVNSKATTGWSTYLMGNQTDIDTFKNEIKKVSDHIRKHNR